MPIASRALFALSLGLALAAQNPTDKKAKEDFDRAERAIQESHYENAWNLYRQLARKYPETAWGKMAGLRTQPTGYFGWGRLVENGPSSNRVDVVVMGDGYALDDQNEFEDIARTVADVFRKEKVLDEYFTYHNFVRVNLLSKDQGVTGFGRTKDTALGGYIAGQVQGQVGVDTGKATRMLDMLDEHDGYAIAIVKAGSMGTGGGGIAAIGGRADATLVHEWGHAFGGLSDEYSTFTGHRGSPRDTINVSTTDDETKVPWRHFVAAKYPGVGAYRGADGRIKGAWKPTSGGCIMESGGQWCPVCRERMVLQIYRRVDPIEDVEPAPTEQPIAGKGGVKFAVSVLEPKTHRLDVRFFVLPKQGAIKVTKADRIADRTRRGALAPLAGDGFPAAYVGRGHASRSSSRPASWTRAPTRVVCRVRDDTQPSGQARPWVVKDSSTCSRANARGGSTCRRGDRRGASQQRAPAVGERAPAHSERPAAEPPQPQHAPHHLQRRHAGDARHELATRQRAVPTEPPAEEQRRADHRLQHVVAERHAPNGSQRRGQPGRGTAPHEQDQHAGPAERVEQPRERVADVLPEHQVDRRARPVGVGPAVGDRERHRGGRAAGGDRQRVDPRAHAASEEAGRTSPMPIGSMPMTSQTK
ncbi:MAG: M64 family metallopeptidase [Planctomycetota bacterium]